MSEQLQKILYSSNENEPLQEYIGIGSTDCDPQDPESYLLPDDRSFDGWKHFFSDHQIIAPIVALNYILISGMPEHYFPQQIFDNFNRNRMEIESIIHNWFEEDSSLFRYLDFSAYGINEEAKEVQELSDDETKYILNNGSFLVINENETNGYQCFIPSTLLTNLEEDIILLSNLLVCKFFIPLV